MAVTSGNIVIDTEEYVQRKYPQLLKEAMLQVFTGGLVKYLEERKWSKAEIEVAVAKAVQTFNNVSQTNGGHPKDTGAGQNLINYKNSLETKSEPQKPRVCMHGITFDAHCYNCIRGCPDGCRGSKHEPNCPALLG